jgi:hypothetical protein
MVTTMIGRRPVRSAARSAIVSAVLCVVCGAAGFGCEADGGGDGADPDAGMGSATLSFMAKSSVQKAKALVDPLEGTVYGSIFLTEDVNVAGPIAGAEAFGAVEVAGLDLQGEGKVDGAFETPKLLPGSYTFLGFFDVDGNGAESHDPDPGDPVTLAITNHFVIEAGKTTAYTVVFDLVLN